MAECPQFQLMPQVVPIYRPQPPPTAFPMPGQPIFPMPAHFGYPPIAWSPIPHYPPPPPTPQPTYNHVEEDDEYNVQQPTFNNNSSSVEDSQSEQHLSSHRPQRTIYARNISNKFDTRHEEFRKYLEEMGILSTFTNILAEMYQDPLRPNEPLEYIRNKLSCSRPESVELSNLRIWCEEYQTKTLRLEKELKHVIERLRKHEPYETDDSTFNENPIENSCKSCASDGAKQGHILGNKEENANYESVKNNNQQ